MLEYLQSKHPNPVQIQVNKTPRKEIVPEEELQEEEIKNYKITQINP
jgi:hypothetical protein